MTTRPLVAFDGSTLQLPGFVTAHSHAFQRGLRGMTQRPSHTHDSFWTWREAMYQLADSLTPETMAILARRAFRELRLVGVTAVGEFHYVHHQAGGVAYSDRTVLADVVIDAALREGLRITLLRTAYARAGANRGPEGTQQRFSDPTVDLVLRDLDTLRTRWSHDARVKIGIAPHSVRAVSSDWLKPLHDYARTHQMPFHMHVAEVQGEIDACLAEHNKRPVELLADVGVLDERFVAVHATNLTPTEVSLLGKARSFVCVCPTTERDLGDGLAELTPLREAGVRLCTGVDSHVVSDPIEEARALETHERLRLKKRVTFTPTQYTPAEQLLIDASIHGALACGWDVTLDGHQTTWDLTTSIDLTAPALEGVAREHCLDALMFSGNVSCVRSVTNNGEAR
jgi:formimidoylglutamate deiminase